MTSSSTTEFLRYAVLFIALGLLAPYAGCNIFTSSPRDDSGSSAGPAVESSGRNKQNTEQRRSRIVEGAGTDQAPTQLDELQELLSE